MTQTFVTCTHCAGKGNAPLEAVLEQTLAVISRTKWMSTDEIRAKLADPYLRHQSAMNNRLSRLHMFGCVLRERRGGKLLFWKRIK